MSKKMSNNKLCSLIVMCLPWLVKGQIVDDAQVVHNNHLLRQRYQYFSEYFNQQEFKLKIFNVKTEIAFFQLAKRDLVIQSYGFYPTEGIQKKEDIYTLIDRHNFSRSLVSHRKNLNRNKPSDLRLRCKQYYIILASETNTSLHEGELYLKMIDDQVYLDPSIERSSGQIPINLIYGQYCYYL